MKKTEELISNFIQDYLSEMNLELVTIICTEELNSCLLILTRVQKNMFSSISLMEVSNKFRLKNIVEGMFGCECLIDITWNKKQVYTNG